MTVLSLRYQEYAGGGRNDEMSYCGNEMREGKICAIGSGAALEWKERGETFRLNTEPKMVAVMNGDRIAGYRCEKYKKIILEYE